MGSSDRSEARGTTLAAILDDLETEFAGLRFRTVDEQSRITTDVRMLVNGDLAPTLAVPVGTGQDVQVLLALSGR